MTDVCTNMYLTLIYVRKIVCMFILKTILFVLFSFHTVYTWLLSVTVNKWWRFLWFLFCSICASTRTHQAHLLSTDLFDIFPCNSIFHLCRCVTHIRTHPTHALKHHEFSHSFISKVRTNQILLSHYILRQTWTTQNNCFGSDINSSYFLYKVTIWLVGWLVLCTVTIAFSAF